MKKCFSEQMYNLLRSQFSVIKIFLWNSYFLSYIWFFDRNLEKLGRFSVLMNFFEKLWFHQEILYIEKFYFYEMHNVSVEYFYTEAIKIMKSSFSIIPRKFLFSTPNLITLYKSDISALEN